MLCKGVLPTSEAFFFFFFFFFFLLLNKKKKKKHESGTHYILTVTSFEARITRGEVHDIGARLW